MEVIKICEKVLARLGVMGYERETLKTKELLIFPNKKQAKGDVKRISEQELRFLFVEEFKIKYPELYYSVETPTEEKYRFGKKFADISAKGGRSASLDMCIYKKKDETSFERELNIEFKYDNVSLFKIGKDILKLIHEKQNGVFILLLKNTDSGTLCNSNIKGKGVFNKFKESFEKFKDNWFDMDKSIQLVIISLEQNTLIHHRIKKGDNLKDIFSFDDKFGDIKEVKGRNGWEII